MLGSIILTGFVTLNTYLNEEDFYPTVIYMVKSKAILLVLFNFVIALSILTFKILTRVFFSQLKDAELQNMESESMHHGFNLIIVLYMLHLDFDWHIASHLALNIYVHSLHTLANKRVEYVSTKQLFTERYPPNFYLRMAVFHLLLIALDLYLVTIEDTKSYETLSILLHYEYILMGLFASKSLLVYLLQMYEKIFRPGGWENKVTALSFLEFLHNFTTLAVLIVEFAVLSTRSEVGIYFIDKSLRAVANMWKFLSGYMESRKLLSKVSLFPDASIEEIHNANDKCIFCLDHLTEAKRINCGHLFHYKCLRSYFENSNSPKCPTCRADIDEKIIPQQARNEQISQNVASSFLLQDLPNHVTPIGNPMEIGALAWGLPQAVTGHRISRHNEKMRQAVESMNEFIIRFYKHPPDQQENEVQVEEKEDQYKHLKENFLKMFDQ